VGVLLHALGQTAGNDLAHAGGLGVLVGSSGGCSGGGGCTSCRLVLLNVLLGDLASLAGALNGADGDALLERELLDGRRDRGLALKSRLEAVTGGFGLNGSRSRLLLGRRSRLGASVGGLAGFRSLALLGGGIGLLVAASIFNGKGLKGRDVLALLDQDSNGLEGVSDFRLYSMVGLDW
jgi:hypothetical protein